MIISSLFSVAIYSISAGELGRQLPPDSMSKESDLYQLLLDRPFNDYLEGRIDEGRHSVALRLVLLNIVTLIGGGALSYYLARRTLRPIENNMLLQEQFVSDASHELRTPLTSLLTSNEVALRRKNLSGGDAKKLLHQNIQEYRKLQNLTSSLLEVAKHTNATINRVPTSLQDIVSLAVNEIVPTALAKGMMVSDEVPHLQIRGDRDSLVRAVVTILDNAVKYSPLRSTIYLSGHSDSLFAYLMIRDEGSGIDAVDLPHIFERFYRAEQSRDKQTTDGFGIGLSLAKKIICQHHGDISAASPGGAEFTIKLPLA